jgi:hypothetical protein
LFADFTICPSEPFKPGAAQPAIVKSVKHPHVIAEWPPPESPREFVEQFYAWYAPRTEASDTAQGWNKALKLMYWDLSPQLAKLLEEDSAAQAKCKELIGLDFDPILNTQDPAEQYEVGIIDKRGSHYFAKIHRVDSGRRKEASDVIAEFVRQGGRLFFLNFYDPKGETGLVSILKSPRPKCSVPHEPERK